MRTRAAFILRPAAIALTSIQPPVDTPSERAGGADAALATRAPPNHTVPEPHSTSISAWPPCPLSCGRISHLTFPARAARRRSAKVRL